MQTRKSDLRIGSLARLFTLLALAFGAVAATPACADTSIVTNSADSGPGSLRDTVYAAQAGAVVFFDPSLSGATIYFADMFFLGRDVTIDGSGLSPMITLSGDTDNDGAGNLTHIMTLGPASVTVTLKNLIIAKGHNRGDFFGAGGAIYNSERLVLTGVTISDSDAQFGAGIYNAADGTLILENCTLSGNSGLSGAGIQNRGVASITNSVISGNTATGINGGGGIYNPSGTVTVTNSTISGNTAGGFGGGINNSGTLTMVGTTLSGNAASSGGAIFNSLSLTATNSTIANNAVTTDGGGIYNAPNGVANVYSTSIVYNAADSDGDFNGTAGGVNNVGLFSVRNTLMAVNTVGVAGGFPVYDDCGGTPVVYSGFNVIGMSGMIFGSCVLSGTGTFRQLDADLSLLGPLQNNGGPTETVALRPGSTAVDGVYPVSGVNQCTDGAGALIAADQRGVLRPKGVRCDVGAYELAPDTDGDGLADELDNCTLVANPTQRDADSDGYGNLCDADLNNSALVTTADFGILRSVLNQGAGSSATAAAADLNGSGTVTTADFAILRARLNTAPGPSGRACAGTIPCP